jgi:hypothetical protein
MKKSYLLIILALFSINFYSACGDREPIVGTYDVKIDRRINDFSGCFSDALHLELKMMVTKDTVDYKIEIDQYVFNSVKIDSKGAFFIMQKSTPNEIIFMGGFKGEAVQGMFTYGMGVNEEGYVKCYDDYIIKGIRE